MDISQLTYDPIKDRYLKYYKNGNYAIYFKSKCDICGTETFKCQSNINKVTVCDNKECKNRTIKTGFTNKKNDILKWNIDKNIEGNECNCGKQWRKDVVDVLLIVNNDRHYCLDCTDTVKTCKTYNRLVEHYKPEITEQSARLFFLFSGYKGKILNF